METIAPDGSMRLLGLRVHSSAQSVARRNAEEYGKNSPHDDRRVIPLPRRPVVDSHDAAHEHSGAQYAEEIASATTIAQGPRHTNERPGNHEADEIEECRVHIVSEGHVHATRKCLERSE